MALIKLVPPLDTVAYSTAKKTARAHGISSPSGWAALARQWPASKKRLPVKPDQAYAPLWEGWARFLGSSKRIGRPEKYWEYPDAKRFVQALGLTSKESFQAYARTRACPLEIPVTPHVGYQGKGWQGYADFLGLPIKGIATSRLYWPYGEAREFIHCLKFATTNDWRIWSHGDSRPVQLPLNPSSAYMSKGWVSWGDFLGPEYQKASQLTGLKRKLNLLSYAKARALVITKGFDSAQDFRIWAKSGERPEGIPNHPEIAYQGKAWQGWAHFLRLEAKRGLGRVTSRDILSYSAASNIIKSFKLTSAKDYFDLLQEGGLPNGLPARPDERFALEGWVSWAHFLGASLAPTKPHKAGLKIRPDGALRFEDARKFVQALKLPGVSAWFRYARSGRRPVYIPREPWKAYFQDGYFSLEDFLGV